MHFIILKGYDMFETFYDKFDFQRFLVGTLITLACYLYYTTMNKYPKDYPPGPKGLPFLGVVPLLTSRPDKKIFVSFHFHT